MNHSISVNVSFTSLYSQDNHISKLVSQIKLLQRLFEIKGIANLFLCGSQKLYLILIFTKTMFLICLNLSQNHITLKDLRNSILCTILVWSLLYSIRVYISLYFLPFLLENQLFCLSALFVFSVYSEFDVIFRNFFNFCIIIIHTELCLCSQLSLLT